LEGYNNNEICGLQGYYVACGGNFLQTFRENLSVPPSKMEPIVGPETSARNYQHALRKNQEERRSQIAPYCAARSRYKQATY